MKRINVLPLVVMERLLKTSGARRVSDSAKAPLEKALRDYGTKLCKLAIASAENARRKTVTERDIELAVQYLK